MSLQRIKGILSHKEDYIDAPQSQVALSFIDKAVIALTTIALLSFFVAYESLLSEQLHIHSLIENYLTTL